MPDAADVLRSRLTLAGCCRHLGIDPPLQPGETLNWIGRNPATGVGINAALYCFDPARDDEPYVLSLGAYEEARIAGPQGEDYGTDRRVIASLDFALEGPDGAAPQPLVDPPNACLKLVQAEWGAGLAGEDDWPLDARLAEVGRMLAGWPATRERGDD